MDLANPPAQPDEGRASLFAGRAVRLSYLACAAFSAALSALLYLSLMAAVLHSKAPPSWLGGISALFWAFAPLAVSIVCLPATVSRLHDFGWSGLWTLPLILADWRLAQVALCALDYGFTRVFPNEKAFACIVLGCHAAIFLWPGSKRSNRYGPPPRRFGFSRTRAR